MAEKKNTINPGRASQTNEVLTSSGITLPQSSENLITFKDLKSILEVNQKAMTIYLEVERQNEEIMESLSDQNQKIASLDSKEYKIVENQEKMIKLLENLTETAEETEGKMDDIDKNIFRLWIVLGSTGIGLIVTIIQQLIARK